MSPINNAMQGINQADYLKLFMQELTYQDPLKPLDNREFMTQMAQFSLLQEAKSTNEAITNLTSLLEVNQGLNLLGKRVKIKNSDEEGRVTKIQLSATEPVKVNILMNGTEVKEINLNDIVAVWNPA